MGVKGLRERRKFPGPFTERSKAKTKQSRITLDSKLKIVPDHKNKSCHGRLALNRYGYGEDEQVFRKRKTCQERLNFSCSLTNNESACYFKLASLCFNHYCLGLPKHL